MTRRIGELSLGSVDDLPLRCRGCVYWELSPGDRAVAMEHDPEFEKEAWLSGVCLEAGSAGKVLYVDGTPVGYALLGATSIFPRSAFFPARVSKDALFLAVAHIVPEWQGRGHGKALIQAVLKEAKERNKRAVECFADRQWTGPDCLLPAEFCERLGLRVPDHKSALCHRRRNARHCNGQWLRHEGSQSLSQVRRNHPRAPWTAWVEKQVQARRVLRTPP